MKSRLPVVLLGSSALAVSALTACKDVTIDPYYEDGAAPTVTGIEPASEPGNMGGQTVTLTGTGFGTDPAELVVTIGGHNAAILSASDSSVVIETPPGPLSGGPVEVVVATPGGYAWNDPNEEGAVVYTYDVAFGAETSPYTNETAYMSIQNLWTSCLGGMWDQSGTPLEGSGCETIAYVGSTGITGSSEWWKSPWPRGHADQVGWVGNTDFAPEWRVQKNYQINGVSGYDSVRFRPEGRLYLENPVWEGERLCVDPTEDPADNSTNCSDDGAVEYDLDELRFCEQFDAADGGTRRFAADWNAKKNFFASEDNDDANFEPTTVILRMDDANLGLDGAEITLPGSAQILATSGFGDSEADSYAWGATGAPEACLDGNGDGSTTLDEDGIVLSWTPVPEDLVLTQEPRSDGPYVDAAQTYVMVSITWLPLDWFGLSPGGPRASIVVPDNAGEIAIPNSVLYQFPTPNFDYAGLNEVTQTGRLGTFDSRAAYLLIEAYRYTDLRVVNPNAHNPTNLVVSYVTGDLSFVAGWDNPTERDDDCDDCIDGDGDGWVDDLDPDCGKTGTGLEENATSASTCNDGIDNNGDGKTDAEDSLCKDGSDGESTCDDDEDNDGDGWIDGLDSECDLGDQEAGNDDPSATCSDGLDNDADGWIDGEDPKCTKGSDLEDDGFGLTACNDGIDNDGHGDVDADDPFCWDNGADAVSETVAVGKSQCADLTDNDNDVFVDAFDPDCEIAPTTRELVASWKVDATHPVVPECYDGVDNDGDGKSDGEDPSCWRGDLLFQADGFLDDEAKDWGTGCTDGTDNDLDGWKDGDDPDCLAGNPARQAEDLGVTGKYCGSGTTSCQCNDGLDNDGDGKFDADDDRCGDGLDNIEN